MSILSTVNIAFVDTRTLLSSAAFSYVIRTIFLGRMKTSSDKSDTIRGGGILCPSSELDLGITLKGGQSFRWSAHDGEAYRGVYDNCVWTLKSSETTLFYKVQGPQVENKNHVGLLRDYFRIDLSLEENCKKWAASDKHFEKSLSKTNGVRILDQDVVENLFSFICSSNNNIQRISSMVEKMCSLFGDSIETIDGKEYFSFPSIESLAKDDVEAVLKREKFGYRAGFIVKTAKHLLKVGGRKWLIDLKKENNTTYATAREQLMTLPGVGPKVADCVCLMSLGHLEAIPIDTHIFQIVKANYLPHLSNLKTVTPKMHEEIGNHLRELWGPMAGWAQAVVFCAKINSTGHNSEAAKRKSSTDKKLPQKKVSRKR